MLGEARKNLPYLLPLLVLDDVQTQARNVQWEEEMEWEEEIHDDYDDDDEESSSSTRTMEAEEEEEDDEDEERQDDDGSEEGVEDNANTSAASGQKGH
ncbi:MAG: hypothetical protein ACK55Z_37655, partial [bacterium]